MKIAEWLILAVSLGLFTYSLTAILTNGYKQYLLYPILLAIINIIALLFLKYEK